MMELELVQAGEDRWQIVDRRGRLVMAFGSEREARAFAQGYKTGREDATAIVRNALEPLSARVALSRS